MWARYTIGDMTYQHKVVGDQRAGMNSSHNEFIVDNSTILCHGKPPLFRSTNVTIEHIVGAAVVWFIW